MARMTPAEYKAFMTHGTRTAKVATVRQDGHPHVVPVWFDLEDDTVVFTTGSSSVKARNIRRDPRVGLCVDDQAPPYAFVTIEGTATLHDDLDQLLYWATRIAARYVGADRAEEYGKRNGVPGELIVRVSPAKIVAEKDISD